MGLRDLFRRREDLNEQLEREARLSREGSASVAGASSRASAPGASGSPSWPQFTMNPDAGSPEYLIGAVRDLVAAGKAIEAIKVVRATTGLGLAEAKAAVEAFVASHDAEHHGGALQQAGAWPHGAPDHISGGGVPLERMAADPGPAADPELASEAADFERHIVDVHASSGVIEAIKQYRALTGVGLAEAKSAVEAIVAKRGR